MRLKTVVAPDARQALACLRAELGEHAIIVATQDLPKGGVRITGAIECQDLDLAELLMPVRAGPSVERLLPIATHHELPEDLRQRLFEAARAGGASQPVVMLADALNATFRFEPLGSTPAGTLLLTGPPGAGKTASVAKLAAAAVLDGRPVRVVTADINRAGGLEQLAGLLAPLGLRPQPVPEPSDLRRFAAAAAGSVILIDSPGLNPFRPGDLGALSSLMEASRAELVPVLPAGMAVADSAEIADTYRALGARRFVATKLDAVRRLGGLLGAADSGLAFAEAGIGPTIGQGLRPLSPGGLARLLLRHQELASARDAGSPPAGRMAAQGRSA
jgi:flagellar biosynthesis protein FlhF